MHPKRALSACLFLLACEGAYDPPPASTSEDRAQARAGDGVTYRADVTPVTSAGDTQRGVFIPPFRRCSAPRDGRPGRGPEGTVCSNVSIAGATEPGRYFADYASCDVVVTQRPYWPAPPAGTTPPDDPRLDSPEYMRELAWVTEQVAATGCVCCHDAQAGRPPAQWDIRAPGVWLDSLSDPGLALFAGLADSSVLGAYAPEDNFGFARDLTGIPSDDPPRMQRFMREELARRGRTEAWARAVPPFGGPIYAAQVAPPTQCRAGEGVDADGRVRWGGGPARYVYVLEGGAKNPGVPPNLDLPEGTLWRLDVLASASPVDEVTYGQTPTGSFQSYPEAQPPAELETGKTYHLTVLRDVGLPIVNCLFTFGEASVPPPASPTPVTPSTSEACGAEDGFGASCSQSSDCSCGATYCAVQPGQSEGYCTKTGCSGSDLSVCPSGWSCFDLSRFVAGEPAFCMR